MFWHTSKRAMLLSSSKNNASIDLSLITYMFPKVQKCIQTSCLRWGEENGFDSLLCSNIWQGCGALKTGDACQLYLAGNLTSKKKSKKKSTFWLGTGKIKKQTKKKHVNRAQVDFDNLKLYKLKYFLFRLSIMELWLVYKQITTVRVQTSTTELSFLNKMFCSKSEDAKSSHG